MFELYTETAYSLVLQVLHIAQPRVHHVSQASNRCHQTLLESFSKWETHLAVPCCVWVYMLLLLEVLQYYPC